MRGSVCKEAIGNTAKVVLVEDGEAGTTTIGASSWMDLAKYGHGRHVHQKIEAMYQ